MLRKNSPLTNLHHHLSLNREGRFGTINDFATSFLHFSLFSATLWDLPNSTWTAELLKTGRQRVACVFSRRKNSTKSRLKSLSGRWLSAAWVVFMIVVPFTADRGQLFVQVKTSGDNNGKSTASECWKLSALWCSSQNYTSEYKRRGKDSTRSSTPQFELSRKRDYLPH